jgi:hypothetical protein
MLSSLRARQPQQLRCEMQRPFAAAQPPAHASSEPSSSTQKDLRHPDTVQLPHSSGVRSRANIASAQVPWDSSAADESATASNSQSRLIQAPEPNQTPAPVGPVPYRTRTRDAIAVLHDSSAYPSACSIWQIAQRASAVTNVVIPHIHHASSVLPGGWVAWRHPPPGRLSVL